MKSYKCYVDMEGERKNKVWRTDGVPTYCCCTHVWERNTKYNGHNGYDGYVQPKHVTIINPEKLPKYKLHDLMAIGCNFK